MLHISNAKPMEGNNDFLRLVGRNPGLAEAGRPCVPVPALPWTHLITHSPTWNLQVLNHRMRTLEGGPSSVGGAIKECSGSTSPTSRPQQRAHTSLLSERICNTSSV